MKIPSLAAVLVLALAPAARAQDADSTGAAVAAARTAADAWLRLVDEAQYGASWDSAAAAMRQAVSRADWEAAVIRVRGPLEPFGERTLLGATYATSLPGAPPGQYVVIQFETRVAGGVMVLETVTPMREPDGRWRVSGYYVRPRG